MSNTPRRICESKTYHITQRGVNQVDIFENDIDRALFARLLNDALESQEVRVIAWCFMSDHVHLLLNGEMNSISNALRNALSAYAKKFNYNHARSGALFQSRFHSKPVENDAQFITVIRYIHRNPVAAHLCARCDQHAWSSYAFLRGDRQAANRGLNITPENRSRVQSYFRDARAYDSFHHESSARAMLDPSACLSVSDDEMRELAFDILGCFPSANIGRLPREKRDTAIRILKAAGFSLRLIQRLTGINYNAIRNA